MIAAKSSLASTVLLSVTELESEDSVADTVSLSDALVDVGLEDSAELEPDAELSLSLTLAAELLDSEADEVGSALDSLNDLVVELDSEAEDEDDS